jgi:glycosyltransferase involved in cell wall biosynthesis
MKLSIVICSYNRAQYIGDALDSLYNQTSSLSAFEVILVDNNSTDGTPEVYSHWRVKHPDGNFQYLTEHRQGASYARNTGAVHAKTDWLCFMDDDAVAFPDFVANIIKHTQEKPTIVGFGGKIIPKYIPEKPVWMSYYVSSLVGNFDYSPVPCAFKKGKYPLESNMVVKKSVFDQIGGFNTSLPGVVGTVRIGGEGKELFYKILELGEIIHYDPSIIVYHVVETSKLTKEYLYRVASGIGRGERVRTLSISRMAYLKKLTEYIFKLGASVILGIKYAIMGNPSQSWKVIQFRIDAILGLLNR